MNECVSLRGLLRRTLMLKRRLDLEGSARAWCFSKERHDEERPGGRGDTMQ